MKIIPLLCGLTFLACQFPSSDTKTKNETSTAKTTKTSVGSDAKPDTLSLPQPLSILKKSIKYAWKQDPGTQDLLINRILPPAGYTRTEETEVSYASWLRHLPLKAPETPVLLYNGERKGRQDVHAAVVDIDVGKRDLQQCADAVMRLRAEYLYSQKAFSKIHFNYTSGDKVSFDDWRQGRKPRIVNDKVVFTPKTGTADNSYKNFQAYLLKIFNYAGTASLSKELRSIAISEMQIGDVFIQGGFPGHAVLVLDMVINTEGKKCFLLAQSYMPAQSIHILRNPMDENLSPWYSTEFGETLATPEWTFDRDQLARH